MYTLKLSEINWKFYKLYLNKFFLLYWRSNILLYVLNIEFFYEIYKTKIIINIYIYIFFMKKKRKKRNIEDFEFTTQLVNSIARGCISNTQFYIN